MAADFNQTGGIWSGGDFNYDGTVNLLDFNLLASNFGAALPSPALGTLVPEPVAGSILCAGVALCMRRRKRSLV